MLNLCSRNCRFKLSEENSSAVALEKVNKLSVRPAVQHSSQLPLSKESKGVSESSIDRSSKENMLTPMIAAVEGGFHTQFLLFTRNNVNTASAAAKMAFLLKVQSNCCWDSIRPRILEMITKHCPDNSVYPPLEKTHIGGFLVEILPKADFPETLPPDAQKKMMSRTLHAICIRITVDHAAMNSPLGMSLPTGISAFTKLKLKFPDKSYRNTPSPRSVIELGGNTDAVTQSSSPTVANVHLENSRLQTTKPAKSVRLRPPILSQSSADSGVGCSTKLKLITVDVADSKLPSSSRTSSAVAVGSMQPLPPEAFSPEFSSVSSSNSVSGQKNQQSTILPVKESVKLSQHILESRASGNGHILKAFPGSVSVIRPTLREARTASPAEVIIVDDDSDSLCADSESAESDFVPSNSPASPYSSSHVVQNVTEHNSGTTSPGQWGSTVNPCPSQVGVHPTLLSQLSGSGAVPAATSASHVAYSQQGERPDMMETAALQSTSSISVRNSTAVKAEQLTETEQNETKTVALKNISSVQPVVVKVDPAAAVDIPQPVAQNAASASATKNEESSDDIENFGKQKRMDGGDHDHSVQHVASGVAEVAGNGAAELSATCVDQLLQPLPADASDMLSRADSVSEIAPVIEVPTFLCYKMLDDI